MVEAGSHLHPERRWGQNTEKVNQLELSARLYGWVDGVHTKTGVMHPTSEQAEAGRDLAACRDWPGKAGFKKASQQGHDMAMEESVHLALE